MVATNEKDRLKTLLKDTITLLCKNGLAYKSCFNVEALIGITLDQDDVFLVSINEQIRNASAMPEHKKVFPGYVDDTCDDNSVSDADFGISDTETPRKRKRPNPQKTLKPGSVLGNAESAESDLVDREILETRMPMCSQGQEVNHSATQDSRVSSKNEVGRIVVKQEPDKWLEESDCTVVDDPQSTHDPDLSNVLQESSGSLHMQAGWPPTQEVKILRCRPQSYVVPPWYSRYRPQAQAMLPGQSRLQSPLKAPATFQCNICHNVLSSKTEFRRHMNRHAGIYLYNCPTCGKGFSCTTNLRAHVAKQNCTGHQASTCPECHNVFPSKIELGRHVCPGLSNEDGQEIEKDSTSSHTPRFLQPKENSLTLKSIPSFPSSSDGEKISEDCQNGAAETTSRDEEIQLVSYDRQSIFPRNEAAQSHPFDSSWQDSALENIKSEVTDNGTETTYGTQRQKSCNDLAPEEGLSGIGLFD